MNPLSSALRFGWLKADLTGSYVLKISSNSICEASAARHKLGESDEFKTIFLLDVLPDVLPLNKYVDAEEVGDKVENSKGTLEYGFAAVHNPTLSDEQMAGMLRKVLGETLDVKA